MILVALMAMGVAAVIFVGDSAPHAERWYS